MAAAALTPACGSFLGLRREGGPERGLSTLCSGEQTLIFQALRVGRTQHLTEGLLSSSQQHHGRGAPLFVSRGERNPSIETELTQVSRRWTLLRVGGGTCRVTEVRASPHPRERRGAGLPVGGGSPGPRTPTGAEGRRAACRRGGQPRSMDPHGSGGARGCLQTGGQPRPTDPHGPPGSGGAHLTGASPLALSRGELPQDLSPFEPLLQSRGVSRWGFLLVPTHPPLSWASHQPQPQGPPPPGWAQLPGAGPTGRPRRVFAQEPGGTGGGHPSA